MRPKSRMKPLLKKLHLFWSSSLGMQDLRLGQLLYLLAAERDLFNLEDNELEKTLDRYLDALVKKDIYQCLHGL